MNVIDTSDPLWVCVDCVMFLANGDTPEGDGAASPSIEERIDRLWGAVSDSTAKFYGFDPSRLRWDLCVGGECTCDDRDVTCHDLDCDETATHTAPDPEASWTCDEPWCTEHAPEGAEFIPECEGECDEIVFERSSCDTCGCYLAGSRHKASALLVEVTP